MDDGFVIRDSDAERIEAAAGAEQKTAWQTALPQVIREMRAWDEHFPEVGADVVKWVVFMGPGAIKHLPEYLAENLGLPLPDATRIAARLAREVLGSFLKESTARRHQEAWDGVTASAGEAPRAASHPDEIAVHRSKAAALAAAHGSALSAGEEAHRAARIFKASAIAADDAQTARSIAILVSRIKEVRTAPAARAALVRPLNQGGAGLAVTAAETLMNALERELKAEDRTHRKNVLIPAPAHELMTQQQTAMIQTTPPHPQKKPQSLPVVARHEQTPVPRTQPPQPVAPVARTAPVAKPKIDDVVYTPELTGPLDALSRLRIVDFRRLSPQPDLALAKVRDRINLLKAESFEQFIKGMKAWKQSAVYRAYLAMLAGALARGSITYGPDTLTKAEVEAIARFNRNLLI